MRRQVFSILVVLVGIYFIIALSRDLVELLSARERLEREQSEVERLSQEQQKLAEQLGYVMSDEFVEKEAREKLLMGKPGEVVMLLPPEEEKVGQEGLTQVKESSKVKELANWQKWIQLFGFYKLHPIP